MLCPVCYNRIKKENNICKFCGFETRELKTASNKGIYKLRKAGKKEKIIYTKEFPTDLDYKKTLKLCVLWGWLGIHNFYIGRKVKGFFVAISTTLLLIASMLLALQPSLIDITMEFVVVLAPFMSLAIIFWIMDIFNLLSRKFKVPVALKKDIKKYGK